MTNQKCCLKVHELQEFVSFVPEVQKSLSRIFYASVSQPLKGFTEPIMQKKRSSRNPGRKLLFYAIKRAKATYNALK